MSQRQRQRAEQHAHRRTQLVVGAGVVGLLALGGVLFLPISGDAPEKVPVSMVDYAFDPVEARAAPGQVLTISNDGAIVHSYLIVDLAKGVELQPGGVQDLHIPTDAEERVYQVICDIPGHVEQGMVGTLEVG
jgi:plastocyanin